MVFHGISCLISSFLDVFRVFGPPRSWILRFTEALKLEMARKAIDESIRDPGGFARPPVKKSSSDYKMKSWELRRVGELPENRGDFMGSGLYASLKQASKSTFTNIHSALKCFKNALKGC